MKTAEERDGMICGPGTFPMSIHLVSAWNDVAREAGRPNVGAFGPQKPNRVVRPIFDLHRKRCRSEGITVPEFTEVVFVGSIRSRISRRERVGTPALSDISGALSPRAVQSGASIRGGIITGAQPASKVDPSATPTVLTETPPSVVGWETIVARRPSRAICSLARSWRFGRALSSTRLEDQVPTRRSEAIHDGPDRLLAPAGCPLSSDLGVQSVEGVAQVVAAMACRRFSESLIESIGFVLPVGMSFPLGCLAEFAVYRSG